MALSDLQRLEVKGHAGTAVTDADMDALSAVVGDDALLVSRHLVAQQLADLTSGKAAQWALTGRYSENRTANLAALKAKLAELDALINPNSAAATGLPEITQGNLTREELNTPCPTGRTPDTAITYADYI